MSYLKTDFHIHTSYSKDADSLATFESYIEAPSSTPLVVFGKSGLGKSSLIAKAIENAENDRVGTLIYRFVGASENSTNIRSLLLSIVGEIDKKHHEELSKQTDTDAFNQKIVQIFSGIRTKTIIFIEIYGFGKVLL